MGSTRIDAVDEMILEMLARNSRVTFADVGARVNLSAPAVKRRVDRLVADGVIKSFTAVVDPAATGWTTEAYVEVFCNGTVAPEKLRTAWEQIPQVVSAATVTGPADALLRMVARDVGDLEAALGRVRRSPHVHHTESIIVLSNLIDRMAPDQP